jgi:hypothetical protein
VRLPIPPLSQLISIIDERKISVYYGIDLRGRGIVFSKFVIQGSARRIRNLEAGVGDEDWFEGFAF